MKLIELKDITKTYFAKADQAQANLDKLVSGDASTAIDTFNEIEAFLKGVTDTETLTGLLAQQKSELQSDAAAKYQPKGSYAAASHSHPVSQLSDLNASWDALLKAAPQAYLTRWPSWGEVTGKPSTFAPSSHNHDDRYPTKTGSGASGTWPIAISGNASTATKSSDSDKLGGKAATEYALKSEVPTLPTKTTVLIYFDGIRCAVDSVTINGKVYNDFPYKTDNLAYRFYLQFDVDSFKDFTFRIEYTRWNSVNDRFEYSPNIFEGTMFAYSKQINIANENNKLVLKPYITIDSSYNMHKLN